MSSFRKDPFGQAWVLISPERGLEASDFGSAHPAPRPSPLAPGADPTLQEVTARRPAGAAADAWRARVLKHPAALLRNDAEGFGVRGETPFLHAAAYGHQELVVEHPDPACRLDAFPREHLVDVLALYRERLADLARRPHVRHVQLTRSVGKAAGAAFDHEHGVVVGAPVPNRWLEEETATARAHREHHGRCLFCEVLAWEVDGRDRVIASNERYVAFAPYASKTPFEAWILSRRHESAFAAEPVEALPELADLLQSLLRTLNTALDDPPYNLVLHTLPHAGDDAFHWHLELLPRLTQRSGFDWGNGFYVNPTPPEYAARFLREGLWMQEVS